MIIPLRKISGFGVLLSSIVLSFGISGSLQANYTWEKEKPKKNNLQLEYELKAAQDKIESLLLKVESLSIELEVYDLKSRSIEEDLKSDSLMLKKN